METTYIMFARRWWWLILLGMILSLTATVYAVSKQTPLYAARSTFQIGRVFALKNPNQDELTVVSGLARAYAELSKQDAVLSATAQTLKLAMTPDDLRARVLVTPVVGTSMINVDVVDTDPVRAAAIANELVRQIILQGPENTSTPQDQAAQSQTAADQAFIRKQIDDLKDKITTGQQDIGNLENQIASMTSAADIADATNRLQALQTQVDNWQNSYAQLLGTVQPSSTNVVDVVSRAVPPQVPMARSERLYYMLALAIGGGVSVLLALGLDLLNPAVRRPDDLQLPDKSIPVLQVPRYRRPREGKPVVLSAPLSDAAAAYRTLRNALQRSGLTEHHLSLAIVSSRVGEGKTTTATNLAYALASAGRDVTLVDANIRNPELAERFHLEHAQGFSDLLTGTVPTGAMLQDVGHEHLRVVGAGTIPANYDDLISRPSLATVVSLLSETASVVLFDMSAVLEEGDALVLSRYVSGVLVVAEAGRVSRPELARTLEVLNDANVRVVAVTLNKIRQWRIRVDRLPWSYEGRLRARAARRRAASRRPVTDSGMPIPEGPMSGADD